MTTLAVHHGPNVMFVSVNLAFSDDISLHDLERHVANGYRISPSRARYVDRVVAVYNFGDDGGGWQPVAAWRVRQAFPSQVTPPDSKPLTMLSLGAPIVVLPEYRSVPKLRLGVAVARMDELEVLPDEITPDEDRDLYGVDPDEQDEQ